MATTRVATLGTHWVPTHTNNQHIRYMLHVIVLSMSTVTRTLTLTRETRTVEHARARTAAHPAQALGSTTATRASTHTSACGTTHSTTALAATRHLLARGRAARAESVDRGAVAPTVRVTIQAHGWPRVYTVYHGGARQTSPCGPPGLTRSSPSRRSTQAPRRTPPR